MQKNTSEDIRQIVQKAIAEDNDAKNATDIVNHVISEMNPQRKQEDKSQNHH